MKDLGVVAIDGGRWEIYVGGAAGAHIRKGDLLATVDDPDEVMTLTGRFLQYYRENANWLERTYAFVPRVGIEQIRAVVVDDSEGIAADSTPRSANRSRAYRDPWKERRGPATPGQFRTVAAAGRPAAGAGPMTDGDDRAARRSVNLGPLDQIPVGEGRAYAVDGEQIAVFRLRDGSLRAVSAPSARTAAARSPTGRSTAACPLPAAPERLGPHHRLLD